MIKFQNVTKIYPYPKVAALRNVSFNVEKGEFVSIIGKSGAGKTTLFKLILGEEIPTEGTLFFKEINIPEINKSNLYKLRQQIGIVFQDYRLIPSKTAYENIAYALEVIGADDEEIKRDVSKVLEITNLTERAESFPDGLSCGEKQRVAIARALIHRPDFIIADEPTGNLDPLNTQEVIQTLVKINELGTTIILVTHNKEIINILGRRVITLEEGKIIRDEERGRFIL
ncbi:ATP-binding cassette domain-containing protein [Candidatus Parcubacteria bacterium]|nr:ATP-binding cassette domain-containing protein [Candidatus Parcubacteria bacterium]